MKYEPPTDRTRLIEAVRELYGIPAEALTFVPVGYAAACYVVHAAGGARSFLKLWPDTSAGRAAASRRHIALPLTHALYQRGLYPRVPYPIPTRSGDLSATVSGTPFALFPFLASHTPPGWPAWPDPLMEELARTIAAIHRATPALVDVLPPREAFDIPFELDLHRGLEAVTKIGPHDRPGLRALRRLVLPRRDEILSQLTRLHRLQHAVRGLPGLVVLCHADIGGDNLLVDAEGRLSVLDWDFATVAPPEYDLYDTVRCPDFGRFLNVYHEAGGAHDLHLDHFAFALLRRFIADMTARLVRILDEQTSAEEDEDALHGIGEWGFAQWADLDGTLAKIAAALRHRHP